MVDVISNSMIMDQFGYIKLSGHTILISRHLSSLFVFFSSLAKS
jgi:hypothetical protein